MKCVNISSHKIFLTCILIIEMFQVICLNRLNSHTYYIALINSFIQHLSECFTKWYQQINNREALILMFTAVVSGLMCSVLMPKLLEMYLCELELVSYFVLTRLKLLYKFLYELSRNVQPYSSNSIFSRLNVA